MESIRRLRGLFFLHKIILNGIYAYLRKLIPKKSLQYMTRNVNDIATYQCRTDAFKFLFFLWTINEWNEIHIKIRNSLYSVFENYLLKEIRRQPSPSYNIHNPLNYLYTRLRLELVNRMNKFNHNLGDYINPFLPALWHRVNIALLFALPSF